VHHQLRCLHVAIQQANDDGKNSLQHLSTLAKVLSQEAPVWMGCSMSNEMTVVCLGKILSHHPSNRSFPHLIIWNHMQLSPMDWISIAMKTCSSSLQSLMSNLHFLFLCPALGYHLHQALIYQKLWLTHPQGCLWKVIWRRLVELMSLLCCSQHAKQILTRECDAPAAIDPIQDSESFPVLWRVHAPFHWHLRREWPLVLP